MKKNTKDQQSENSQAAKKPKSTARKVLSIVGNVLMWAFIVFAIVITIFAFSAQSDDGVPSIGGNVISPVKTDSMEPTINKGDLIFTKKLQTKEEKAALTVGTIITFHAKGNGGEAIINTHRIVEVTKISDTEAYYRTMGDQRGTSEEARANKDLWDPDSVKSVDVISVFTEGESTKIAIVGSIINFLLTPTGFLIVIVIPLVLFFIFEIVMFVRKLLEVKNSGKKQITAEDEEMIKQKAIEEYLRAQREQQEASQGKTEETSVDEAEPTPEAGSAAEEPAANEGAKEE